MSTFCIPPLVLQGPKMAHLFPRFKVMAFRARSPSSISNGGGGASKSPSDPTEETHGVTPPSCRGHSLLSDLRRVATRTFSCELNTNNRQFEASLVTSNHLITHALHASSPFRSGLALSHEAFEHTIPTNETNGTCEETCEKQFTGTRQSEQHMSLPCT